jgi:hypothetical protein
MAAATGPYRFTAMNTLKGQRIRAAANRGNTIAPLNWFDLEKIHQIYQGPPLAYVRLGEMYLLEAPPGEPIRLVILDRLVGNRADLFDVVRQETITVDLGPDYQLHQYFPPEVAGPVYRPSSSASNYSSTTSANFATAAGSTGGRRRRRRSRRTVKKRER